RLELIFLEQRVRNGICAKAAREGWIDWEAGIGIENLVAGLDQRHHGQRKSHLTARSDEHFFRRDVELARALQISADSLAQCKKASRRAIAVPARSHRTAHGVDNRRGRMKVRFAELEMDDGPALALEFLRAREDRQGAFPVELRNP